MHLAPRLIPIAAIVAALHIATLGLLYIGFRTATPAPAIHEPLEDAPDVTPQATTTEPGSGPTTASRRSTSREMPPPRLHEVVAGDNYWQLARKYGVSVDALLTYNNHNRNHTLQVGEILKIPDP